MFDKGVAVIYSTPLFTPDTKEFDIEGSEYIWNILLLQSAVNMAREEMP